MEGNLAEAGKAFLSDLTGGGAPPVIEDPAEGAASDPIVDPLMDPTPPVPEAPLTTTEPVPPQPQIDTAALESVKDAILAEIQALSQYKPAEGETDTPPLEGVLPNEEEFLEKFNEDPVKAITELADSIADKKISDQMMEFTEKMKPFIQESERMAFEATVKDSIAKFMSEEESPGVLKHPDAEKYFSEMAEIIKANNLPQNDPKTYADIYKDLAIRDLRAAQTNLDNSPKSIEDFLSDEGSLSKILENPKVQEKIIESYLLKIAEGGSPQVISNGGSASPSAAPPNEFKTFAEAGSAFKQQLR